MCSGSGHLGLITDTLNTNYPNDPMSTQLHFGFKRRRLLFPTVVMIQGRCLSGIVPER